MNRTYGIKSLAIQYSLYTGIVLYVLYYKSRIQHRHPYSYAPYFLYGALICLSLFIIAVDIARYQLATIKNGEICFRSINPLKKPLKIAINEITGINYIAGKRVEFIITTFREVIKIPASINIYEARKFCNEMIIAGPHIQISEPRYEQQYKKTWRIIRILSFAIAALTLVVMYYKHNNK